MEAIKQLIDRMGEDQEAMRLFHDVLRKQLEYREAFQRFRDHVSSGNGTARATKPATADSIAQRCFTVVQEARGDIVTTETIAEAAGVSVDQVRGSLKRFIKTKQITKPRRGYWKYVVDGRNDNVANNGQLPFKS
jgi:hypothetical protein